jgi:hypothetical protein
LGHEARGPRRCRAGRVVDGAVTLRANAAALSASRVAAAASAAAPAAAPQQPAPSQQQARPADPSAPTEATLGLPIYPSAQFIASYDAGRGQRYYIFGSTAPFLDLVNYYKSVLKDGGDFVFREPPTHMFETGRFRDETMAFPPSVTIKDYTWGGSQGYPNPRRPANPERFPTLIMIVPAPAGAQQEIPNP